MFVVDVWTLVVPSLFRMSAGRPERRSVIATNEAHVWAAYCRSRARAGSRAAASDGTSRSSATSAARDWTVFRMKPPPLDASRLPGGRAPQAFSAGGMGEPGARAGSTAHGEKGRDHAEEE